MKNIITLTLVSVLFTSCASIFGGSSYQAQIIPENPKSTVYVDGEKLGTGTAHITQKRKKALDIKVVSPTGAVSELTVTRKFRWGIQAANVAGLWWWFPIATGIDLISGGAWKPNENIRGVSKVDNNNYKIRIRDNSETTNNN